MVCKECEKEKKPGTREMAPKEVRGTQVLYECEDGHKVNTTVKAYEELDPIPLRICPACAQENRISKMTLTDFDHIGDSWHEVKQRYFYTCLTCASEYCEAVQMHAGNKFRGRRSKDIGLTPEVVVIEEITPPKIGRPKATA